MSGSDKFLNGQKLAQIRLSFTQDLWTRVPFEWQFKVCKFFYMIRAVSKDGYV